VTRPDKVSGKGRVRAGSGRPAGLTYQQITDRLWLSDKKVRNDVGSIY